MILNPNIAFGKVDHRGNAVGPATFLPVINEVNKGLDKPLQPVIMGVIGDSVFHDSFAIGPLQALAEGTCKPISVDDPPQELDYFFYDKDWGSQVSKASSSESFPAMSQGRYVLGMGKYFNELLKVQGREPSFHKNAAIFIPGHRLDCLPSELVFLALANVKEDDYLKAQDLLQYSSSDSLCTFEGAAVAMATPFVYENPEKPEKLEVGYFHHFHDMVERIEKENLMPISSVDSFLEAGCPPENNDGQSFILSSHYLPYDTSGQLHSYQFLSPLMLKALYRVEPTMKILNFSNGDQKVGITLPAPPLNSDKEAVLMNRIAELYLFLVQGRVVYSPDRAGFAPTYHIYNFGDPSDHKLYTH